MLQDLNPIEYGIFGEESQNLTNQKRENGAFSLLIGRNLRPFPENTVLYYLARFMGKSGHNMYVPNGEFYPT